MFLVIATAVSLVLRLSFGSRSKKKKTSAELTNKTFMYLLQVRWENSD